jgi:uncharacterized protein involved in exopolysaccharide biosynthesis
VAGLVLGLALAFGVDRLRGERWRAEAVVGLEEAVAERDLAVEARMVATTAFRAELRRQLEPAVRRELAQPGLRHRLRTAAEGALAAAAERLAGPSVAETLKTRMTPVADAPAAEPALALDAELAGDGRSVVVEARALTATAATALAEAAAAALVDARTSRQREALTQRLDATEAALADGRRRIAASGERIVRGAPAAVAAARDALAEVETRLEAARARLAVSRADRRELAAAAEPPLDLATLADHPRGDAVARAAAARDRAAARLAELDDTYGERHPVRIAAARALAESRDRVRAEAATLVEAVARAETRHAATVEELAAARDERARALAERERAAADAARLEAERRRHRERLEALADTRAELVARRAALAPDARVLLVGDPAPVDGPATTLALYGGGAAGGLALGGLFGSLGRGRSPGRPEDAAGGATTPPVIAEIATPRPQATRPTADDGLERLALRLESLPHPARTLALVTAAPGPAAGRVALALAQVLTRERLTTAVVALTADSTLVPRALARDDVADLDAVLQGRARWDAALQPLGDHGPWLLASHGRTPKRDHRPPPDTLLGELTRRFDRVLVAAGGLDRTESLRAARACRGTLVLVAGRRRRDGALARGLVELDAVGVHADGVVVLR